MELLRFMSDMTISQRDVIIVQANCGCEIRDCPNRNACSYDENFTQCPLWKNKAVFLVTRNFAVLPLIFAIVMVAWGQS